MRGLAIDARARCARIEAGLPWSAVVAAAAEHGLAPLNGSAATVGAVGYLTGGGIGPLSRKHGLAVDHVRGFDLVTPDGQLRRVDAEREPELFWAVRGGKANFGIVTAAEIDLLPVARLYGGGLYFPGEAVPHLLPRYREWVPTLPADSHVALALLRLPRLPHVPEVLAGKLVGHLRITFLGDAEESERHLAPMRALAAPLLDTVREMPYAEVASIHNEPREPMPNWGRGALLRELTAGAVDALIETAGPESGAPLAVVELRPMGGAIARAPERPSAVDGRDAAFTLNILGPLRPGLEDAVPAAGERVLAAVARWTTGGSLINFQGAATAPEQVAAAWRPETYARLARLKRAVDPQHLFRVGHVIEPAG